MRNGVRGSAGLANFACLTERCRVCSYRFGGTVQERAALLLM